MEDKHYPRLSGDGYLMLDETGVTVHGKAWNLTHPIAMRLKLLGSLGGLFGLSLLYPAFGEPILAFGGTLDLLWAARRWSQDKNGVDLARKILWADVDEARASEEVVAILHSSAVLFGSKVPNPIFFTPDDGIPEMIEVINEAIDRHPQPEHLHPE